MWLEEPVNTNDMSEELSHTQNEIDLPQLIDSDDHFHKLEKA